MQQFLKFYYLTFMYSSTCFGRPPAHHQGLNNCSSSLWFYRWSVVVAVQLVVVGNDHDQRHCYHHAPTVKPEAATATVELLMMDGRMPETCWAVHKRQIIKLEKLLHLVGWFEFDFCALSASTKHMQLTHNSGRVTQICLFNTVKLGTSASSP